MTDALLSQYIIACSIEPLLYKGTSGLLYLIVFSSIFVLPGSEFLLYTVIGLFFMFLSWSDTFCAFRRVMSSKKSTIGLSMKTIWRSILLMANICRLRRAYLVSRLSIIAVLESTLLFMASRDLTCATISIHAIRCACIIRNVLN